MSHHVGKEKKKWKAETRLPFQCITWRGLGKTQIKIIIQKLKERKWRRTKEREEEKEERRRRRKRKRGESPEFTVSLTELQLIFHMTRVIFCVRCPIAVRPPPHHQIGSDRLVLLHFFFKTFWFNFIVRIGFCFVFGLFETFFESEAKLDRLVLPSSCVSFYFVFLCFFIYYFFF